jgi:hypothetical protein
VYCLDFKKKRKSFFGYDVPLHPRRGLIADLERSCDFDTDSCDAIIFGRFR